MSGRVDRDRPTPSLFGEHAGLEADRTKTHRRAKKAVTFVRPPKLHITEDGVSVRFQLVNRGDSSVSVSFRLSFKGGTIDIEPPSVRLQAGSDPASLKIDLPLDGGFTKGSKVRVDVQGPGGTTIASSSTGTVSLTLPGGSNIALGPAGVAATAVIGLGGLGTLALVLIDPEPSPLPPEDTVQLVSSTLAVPSELTLSARPPGASGPALYPLGFADPVRVRFEPQGSAEGVEQRYRVVVVGPDGQTGSSVTRLPRTVSSALPLEPTALDLTVPGFLGAGTPSAVRCYREEDESQTLGQYVAAGPAGEVTIVLAPAGSQAEPTLAAEVYVMARTGLRVTGDTSGVDLGNCPENLPEPQSYVWR